MLREEHNSARRSADEAVGPQLAGILVAVGFVIMGIVAIPRVK